MIDPINQPYGFALEYIRKAFRRAEAGMGDGINKQTESVWKESEKIRDNLEAFLKLTNLGYPFQINSPHSRIFSEQVLEQHDAGDIFYVQLWDDGKGFAGGTSKTLPDAVADLMVSVRKAEKRKARRNGTT
jgi:hypothetical protein